MNVIVEDSSCSNGDGNSLGNSNENSEGVPSLLDLHAVGTLPPSTNTDVHGNLNPPAEREDTVELKMDVTGARATLVDRLNANFQDNFKLNEDLKTLFQRWEHEFEEQKRLIFRKGEENFRLQKAIRELINERNLRGAQVVELQEAANEIKAAMGLLRQDVNNLPSLRDDSLDIETGKAFRELCRDKLRLHEDLRKYHAQVESATQGMQLKTHEIEQMQENTRILEEANRKLEQKADKIQQQLCKENAGRHGSYVDGSQTPFLLESTAKDMFSSITAFNSLLSKHKHLDGHNPAYDVVVLTDLWKRVRIGRPQHWTYLLKNWICDYLFDNFQSETLGVSKTAVLFFDHEERVNKCFEYFKNCENKGAWDRAISHARNDIFDDLFLEYCASKFLSLLPWDTERLLCELFKSRKKLTVTRLRELLSRLSPDKRQLLESLILAASKVWRFHKLCLSFEPPATIFGVLPGDCFNQDYMESIDALETDQCDSVLKVGFMTYPGFRLRKSIIKCEVYLALKT